MLYHMKITVTHKVLFPSDLESKFSYNRFAGALPYPKTENFGKEKGPITAKSAFSKAFSSYFLHQNRY